MDPPVTPAEYEEEKKIYDLYVNFLLQADVMLISSGHVLSLSTSS